MKRFGLFLTALALFLSACGTSKTPGTVTATASMPTAEPPTATNTFLPPRPTITPIPIEGTLTTQVNVRSGPDVGTASLGLLNSGEKVRILSKDATGGWYRIVYPPASLDSGWVASRFVQVGADMTIPVEATPTSSGPTGLVMQKLNVRSGPGTTFNSLGMLDANSVVSLTGKNRSASWFQIEYASAPGGRGWVTAQYIQLDPSAELPVLDDYGTPLPPGTAVANTPSGPVPTVMATVGPAPLDGDSSSNPAARVVFSSGGTRQFTYSGKVSAPDGDTEDWIEFTPFAVGAGQARMHFGLSCSGNGQLTVELWQGGSALSGWGSLACGETDQAVSLQAGQPYLIHLMPAAGPSLRLVSYVLTAWNQP